MPLNCPYKLAVRLIDRFCDAIRGKCHFSEGGSGHFYCLMVIAVDIERVTVQQLLQGRVFLERNRVNGNIIGRFLMMLCVRGVLGWDILIKRSTKYSVYKLNATAYSEN